MQTNEKRGFSVRSRNALWVSSHWNGGRQTAESAIHNGTGRVGTGHDSTDAREDVARLFALAERAPISLAERYPRLTFFAISLVLLVCTLTAEFECLHSAGYTWQ